MEEDKKDDCKQPRFSVIICTYNLEKIVKVSIESILTQRFKDFELILVDDCSTDKTYDVLKKYEAKDNRVRVLKNEVNSGPGTSRNNGVAVAKGEYIVYLDGDDTLYDRNTLGKVDKTIGEDGADIIYFGVQYVGGSNKAYLPNAENSTQKARIVCDMHFQVPSKVWNRKFLIDNNIKFIDKLYYGEDMVYSIEAAIKSKKLKYGEFPIYVYYRNREGSIMSTPTVKRCKEMYKVMYYLMALYEETPDNLKPYLMSFIKNETLSIPMRIDATLKAIEDKTFSPVIPKRNYVFTEAEPTVMEEKEDISNPKIIPIDIKKVGNLDNKLVSGGMEYIKEEQKVAASDLKDSKILKFE